MRTLNHITKYILFEFIEVSHIYMQINIHDANTCTHRFMRTYKYNPALIGGWMLIDTKEH